MIDQPCLHLALRRPLLCQDCCNYGIWLFFPSLPLSARALVQVEIVRAPSESERESEVLGPRGQSFLRYAQRRSSSVPLRKDHGVFLAGTHSRARTAAETIPPACPHALAHQLVVEPCIWHICVAKAWHGSTYTLDDRGVDRAQVRAWDTQGQVSGTR